MTRLADLFDEDRLLVKYHIFTVTAVAYAHISITSPASDGEICICVLDCCEIANWFFFSMCEVSIFVHFLCNWCVWLFAFCVMKLELAWQSQ